MKEIIYTHPSPLLSSDSNDIFHISFLLLSYLFIYLFI